jgi:DNA repair exonuclease SbcCD ATPase subunit
MTNVKDKLQKIDELKNKVKRLEAELANNEYIDEDYIFKRNLSEIENDLTQAKENLKEKLEKLVKSIEGKDDTNSLKIAYFLMGQGYSDNNFNLQSRGIPHYLTGE